MTSLPGDMVLLHAAFNARVPTFSDPEDDADEWLPQKTIALVLLTRTFYGLERPYKMHLVVVCGPRITWINTEDARKAA